MGTQIIILILLVIVFFAVRSSLKHFKGEGGCCGGGSSDKEETVKLQNPVVAKKVLHIEGMHCENCSNRVTSALQKMDGVSCKVYLKKKLAKLSMDREISDEDLKLAVEKAGYQVTSIE